MATKKEEEIIAAALEYRKCVLQCNAAGILEDMGGEPSFGSSSDWGERAYTAQIKMFEVLSAYLETKRGKKK